MEQNPTGLGSKKRLSAKKETLPIFAESLIKLAYFEQILQPFK